MKVYQDINLNLVNLQVRRFFTFANLEPNPFWWFAGDVEMLFGIKAGLADYFFVENDFSKEDTLKITGYLKYDLNAFNGQARFSEKEFYSERFGAEAGKGMTSVSLDRTAMLVNSKIINFILDDKTFALSPDLKSWIRKNMLAKVNCEMVADLPMVVLPEEGDRERGEGRREKVTNEFLLDVLKTQK